MAEALPPLDYAELMNLVQASARSTPILACGLESAFLQETSMNSECLGLNLTENLLKKVKIVFWLKKVTFYKIRLKKVTFDGPLPPSLVYTETEQILGLVEPNIELFYFLKPYVNGTF